jgi:hypothetical protein
MTAVAATTYRSAAVATAGRLCVAGAAIGAAGGLIMAVIPPGARTDDASRPPPTPSPRGDIGG